jgi:CheY-like chemotaxis protein/two-component sensor histidine kinase
MQLEESLKEADRRKDLFLATLAHELRNPLAPIRNALHIMKGEVGLRNGLEDERAMAERQVAHLTRLVEDLMDVSRINTGKIELRKQVVELSAIVRNAVDSVASAVHERNHRLSVDLPAEPILLEADPTRLEQILWNLLNNSTKYTDPGGVIQLSVERHENLRVSIHVRDSGLGITPDVLPTVFGMFVQAGHHRGHSRGGLGIGLNLVKNLVEMHGGTIIATSDGEGQGSEFIVDLPILDGSNHRPPAQPSDPPRQNASGLRRNRILIVDDNEDAAKSLSRVLSKIYGQEVKVVHDGPSALQCAVQFQPRIVVLDLGLPGMDGFEVARRLRADPQFQRLRIVALTGWGQEDDRQKSQEAGFDAHLVKPLDPNLLESLLADWSDLEPV